MEYNFWVKLVLFWTVIGAFTKHLIKCSNIDDVQALRKQLLTNTTYDRKIRPLFNQSNTLEVNITLSVYSLADLSVTSGRVKVHVHITATWVDQILTWTPENYGGITVLELTDIDIWMPDINQIYDLSNTNIFKITSGLKLYSDGTVIWMPSGLLTGVCDQKMDYYPLDTQSCQLLILCARYDSNELRFKSVNDIIRMHQPDSGQWTWIEGHSGASDYWAPDDHSLASMSVFYNSFSFKRKPEFIILHMVVPLQLLLILNLFVYLTPLRSGERVSFAITLSLAFVFYASYITEKVPESSKSISIFSIATVVSIVNSSFTVAASTVLCSLASQKKQEVPNWFRRFRRKHVTDKRATQHQKCKDRNVNKEIREAALNGRRNDNHQSACRVKIEEMDNGTGKEDIRHEITWMDVTSSINRICFFINLFVTITTWVVTLCVFVF